MTSPTSSLRIERPGGIVGHVHAGVDAIPAEDWDRLAPGHPERHAFFAAAEAAPPPAFRLGAISVHHDGKLVAAAPLFRTHYRLDTSLDGDSPKAIDRLLARASRLLRVPVVGLGSPMTDSSGIHLAPDLDPALRSVVADVVINCLRAAAGKGRDWIAVLKSVGRESDTLAPALAANGFHRVTSVPVAILPLPYVTLGHYLASLPASSSNYLKRKLRSMEKLRIQWIDRAEDLAPLEPRLLALYDETLSQSGVSYGDFDRLHPHYFSSLHAHLGAGARTMLCWHGDTLVSCQSLIIGKRHVIANKIGMKYPEAREFDLYFVNWLKLIEHAIACGVPEVEMGSTTYKTKILLGGALERRWLYLRMRGPIANRLLRPLYKAFDFESSDAELKALPPDQQPKEGIAQS